MTIYDYFDSCKATERERELIIQYLASLRMIGTLALPNDRPSTTDPPAAADPIQVKVSFCPDCSQTIYGIHAHCDQCLRPMIEGLWTATKPD